MKKLYSLFAIVCLANFSYAQLTVTANATTPTICAGNSTTISASASPVGYSVTSIPTNPQPVQGVNYLAQDGVDIYGLSAGNLNDGRWDFIPIPFTFRFYGVDYDYINVSTNGWVGMGATNSVTTGVGSPLPNAGAPNAVIHAITANLDLRTITTSFVEYFENGSYPNRTFAINFGNIKFFSGGGTANVQVILYETSNIVEIHTTDCSNTTLGKLQGIENSDGSVYSVVTGRNNATNWAGTGYVNSYRFTPDVVTFTWSPSTGLSATTGTTVTATPPSTQTYTVNALNTTNGFTGSANVTVTISAGSYALAAIAGGAQVCQNITVSPGGTNYRDPGTCNIIARIVPAGASPVSNSINTCTKLATASSKRGTTFLYGARQYDAEPIVSPSTSTANVILYYTQAEFNDFNIRAADSGHKLLPTGPADLIGISKLMIHQFHGTGTNPTNYTGSFQSFTTATSGFTVVWNSTRSWWEVTIPVTGFSGFYLTSAKVGGLPIYLTYFKGVQVDRKNQLTWKVNCTSAEAKFEIERSTDGIHYSTIGYITASQLRCNEPFDYTDQYPLKGANYYRIKMIDVDAKATYSNIILLSLKTARFELMSLSPNIISTTNAKLKLNATERNEMTIVITDFSGRTVQQQLVQVQPGLNEFPINCNNLSTGAYLVSGYIPGEKPQTLKLIKQ